MKASTCVIWFFNNDFRHALPAPSCKTLADFNIMQVIIHKCSIKPADIFWHIQILRLIILF